MDRRRALGCTALVTALGVGCFDENKLHDAAFPRDASGDTTPRDGAATDAGRMDAPGFDATEAGLPADMVVPDVDPSDAGADASEAGPVIEGPACEMAPASAASRLVLDGLTRARDFAFDGAGGVAIAQGSTVVLRRGGDTLPVTMVMPGEVVALRYTRAFGLMLAVFNNMGAGTSSGAIYQLPPGSTTATVRQSGLRQPGGLAVDAMDNVWFSDTAGPAPMDGGAAGLIYRMPAEAGGAARVVVTDVPSPTHLLLDAQGRYLFVARSDTNNVMRVDLDPDAGTVSAALLFVPGFARVSGLAQDECGNVYVADEIRNLVWRVPILAGDGLRVITDVSEPRSLMFGAGAPYGPRELYSLSVSDGTLRAANLVARGVPLPVPVR